MLRERFSADLKEAIKAKESDRVSTLRLITAAIKDRDIAVRSQGNYDGVSDEDILGVLARMIKQRQESAKAYEEGGRLDLAAQEEAEIAIIRAYLPRPLTEAEARQAIAQAIADTGAVSIRDMGKVMAELKARHTGRMDFAGASAAIKAAFS
jgi:uncharacterized protein YqeY